MPRADSIPVEDAILAMKQAEPTWSASSSADRVGCSVERVERTLESRDEIGLESPEPTDWSDSDRCPFCGESIADGGPGFVEHVESADDCAVAFACWREGVPATSRASGSPERAVGSLVVGHRTGPDPATGGQTQLRDRSYRPPKRTAVTVAFGGKTHVHVQ